MDGTELQHEIVLCVHWHPKKLTSHITNPFGHDNPTVECEETTDDDQVIILHEDSLHCGSPLFLMYMNIRGSLHW